MFPNNYNNNTMVDTVSYTLNTYTSRKDFLGYNVIDPTNINPYSDLSSCDEGKYYDTSSKTCNSKLV
jgi:hypothetical protein